MYFKKRAIEDFIGDIKEAGERSAEIIKNMLKFARNEKGGFRKCHAETLINETLELAEKDYSMKKNLNFRDIGIVKEIAKDAEWIICVENQIQQVFLNILKNAALAIHNSKGKNGKGLIKFSISRDNGSITVKIRDNGTGMTEDVRKRIFEPFFSTKTTGNGTGLGLSVSYFIVTENHKGTLKVVSAEGKGAEFIIKLPWREHTQE
jgi:signal transduction histidine kinase